MEPLSEYRYVAIARDLVYVVEFTRERCHR
jgi:hypothetical protein